MQAGRRGGLLEPLRLHCRPRHPQTVNNRDPSHQHPQSPGFIWWTEPPPGLPSPVPAINTILAKLDLKPICRAGKLFLGDLTLVVGMPETDPLPDTAQVTYIGPLLWQRPGEVLPDWIMGLSPAKPLIWTYPGNPRYLPGGATPH